MVLEARNTSITMLKMVRNEICEEEKEEDSKQKDMHKGHEVRKWQI